MKRRIGLLALAVLFARCSTQQNVGTRYVKTMALTASQGGTLTVEASESAELAGFDLVVPPGVLPADTTLTLELGLDDVATAPASPAGPVVILGPELTFLEGVQLTLPASASYVGHSGETELWLSNALGIQKAHAPRLSYDSTTRLAVAQVRATGSFQLAAAAAGTSETRCDGLDEAACTADAGCATAFKYADSQGNPCYVMGVPLPQDCRKVFDRCAVGSGSR